MAVPDTGGREDSQNADVQSLLLNMAQMKTTKICTVSRWTSLAVEGCSMEADFQEVTEAKKQNQEQVRSEAA